MLDYVKYYKNQAGGGDHYFRGSPVQKGYGLGDILGGLFRSALPMIKQGAKMLGKEALKTGVGIAADALDGQNVKMAAKNRVRQTGLKMTSRAGQQLSRLFPRKKKPLKRKASGAPRGRAPSKRTKRIPDIFD